jgi:hypothetical protein
MSSLSFPVSLASTRILAGGGVLHTRVEAQAIADGGVRADDDEIGAQVLAQPRQRVARVPVGVGEAELELGAGDVLAGERAQPAGGDLGAEHLGDRGRQPGAVGAAREVAEAEGRDRTARRGCRRGRALDAGRLAARPEQQQPAGHRQHPGGDEHDPSRAAPRRRGQRRGDLAGRGEPARRSALEAATDRRVPALVEAGHQRTWRRRVLAKSSGGGRHRRRSVERQLPGDHLEEHHAEGIEIGGGGELGPLDLLGGHIGGRPDERAGLGQLVVAARLVDARQAEVGDHGAAAVEDDVVRLEVAVQDPGGVRRAQAGEQLQRDRARLVDRERTGAREAGRQRLAAEELHGVEELAGSRAQVEDAADAGVGDAPGELDLALEARRCRRAGRDGRADSLERDRRRELAILGLVDLAHRAGCEESQDAIAPAAERVARRQPLGIHLGRSSARGRQRGVGPLGHGWRITQPARLNAGSVEANAWRTAALPPPGADRCPRI